MKLERRRWHERAPVRPLVGILARPAMTSWLNPARWLLVLAVCLALAAGYAALARHHHAAGYAQSEAKHTAAALVAEQAARAKEQALQAQITKAQDDALIRQKTLQAAAAAARSAADGLRLDLEAYRHSLPGISADAQADHASRISELFSECGSALVRVSQDADGLQDDRRTLIEAWPR